MSLLRFVSQRHQLGRDNVELPYKTKQENIAPALYAWILQANATLIGSSYADNAFSKSIQKKLHGKLSSSDRRRPVWMNQPPRRIPAYTELAGVPHYAESLASFQSDVC
jgi:hypothetical protein